MSFNAKTIFPEYNDFNNVQLYGHQTDFIYWAREQVRRGLGFIMGDTMGLGKTRQCVFLASLTRSFRTLIVAPKSTLFQWIRECKNTYPEAEVYMSGSSTAEPIFLNEGKITVGHIVSLESLVHRNVPIILVSTYHGITPFPAIKDNDIRTAKEYELTAASVYIPELTPLNMFEWNMVIADEAHSLRNGVTISSERDKRRPKTLKFHRMCRLRMARGGVKIASTGTPIQNRKSDLISLFKWIGFRLPVKMDDEWIDEMVRDHVFRRVQENLHPELQLLINFPIDQPDIEDIEVVYKTRDEQQFYEMVAGKIAGVQNGTKSLLDTEFKNIQYEELVLIRINMLRFLSASIDMFIRIHNNRFSNHQLPTWKGTESKIEMIRDLILRMSCENTSVIVFIHFYEEADRIQASFRDYEDDFGENLGYNVFRMNGENTALERDSILNSTRDYISNGKRCLIFANILASSEGINFQSSGFHTLIVASPDWNPKLEEQGIARVHRIGQKEKVKVYRFKHKAIENLKCESDNIDKFMHGTQKGKIEIFDTIFKNKPNAANYSPRILMPGYENEYVVNFDIQKNNGAAEEEEVNPYVRPQFSPIQMNSIPHHVFRPCQTIISKVLGEPVKEKKEEIKTEPCEKVKEPEQIITFTPKPASETPMSLAELREQRLKRFS